MAFKYKHRWTVQIYKDRKAGYLTENQARHIYENVESENVVNISTLKQEINQQRELYRLNDASRDVNYYRELIVNNTEWVDTILSQMEQWSILSNIINYLQYNRYPKKSTI